MKGVRINWQTNGWVTCPHCKHDNDFMDEDEWYEVCEIAETKDFKYPYKINCKNCKQKFNIIGSN